MKGSGGCMKGGGGRMKGRDLKPLHPHRFGCKRDRCHGPGR
jgi:hypothetical protein